MIKFKKTQLENMYIFFSLLLSIHLSLSKNPERTKAPIKSFIINGMDATDPRPFFVNISIDDGIRFCGGSIIAAYWILTTAHCLMEFDSKTLTLLRQSIKQTKIAGYYAFSTDCSDHSIEKVQFLFPNWYRFILYMR